MFAECSKIKWGIFSSPGQSGSKHGSVDEIFLISKSILGAKRLKQEMLRSVDHFHAQALADGAGGAGDGFQVDCAVLRVEQAV